MVCVSDGRFLWETVKDKFYAMVSVWMFAETIEVFKHDIKVAIHRIKAHTIENILKNWVNRISYCKP